MQLPNGKYRWEIDLDFSRTPPGDDLDVLFVGSMPRDSMTDSPDAASFSFSVSTETAITQIWMLMPLDRDHKHFEIVRYPIGKFEQAQPVTPDSQVELPIGSIANFRLLNPEKNYRYECRWRWGS